MSDSSAKSREETQSISIRGWRVQSTKSNSIMGQKEISILEEKVRDTHTPEMVFTSELRVKHEQSEVEFTFNATEALRERKLAENEVIKVKNSERWMQLHLERYGGKKESEEVGGGEGKENNEESSARTIGLSIDELEKGESSYDWTFTTPYRGTTTVRGEDIVGRGVGVGVGVGVGANDRSESNNTSDNGGGGGGGSNSNGNSNVTKNVIQWKPTEERLDMALLTRRDPIELFDELALYESELDDHGVSSLSVKIRVTESCWFLLLRFWLCVDGVIIRSRETRLCCDLRQRRARTVVLRETRVREETWSQLKDRGAPTDAKKYKNAEDAASVLLASGGPVHVVNEKLEIF